MYVIQKGYHTTVISHRCHIIYARTASLHRYVKIGMYVCLYIDTDPSLRMYLDNTMCWF